MKINLNCNCPKPQYNSHQKRCNNQSFCMAMRKPINIATGESAQKEFIQYTNLPEMKKSVQAFIEKCNKLTYIDLQPVIRAKNESGITMRVINGETGKNILDFAPNYNGEKGIGYDNSLFFDIKKFFYSIFAPEKTLPKNMVEALQFAEEQEKHIVKNNQAQIVYDSLKFAE